MLNENDTLAKLKHCYNKYNHSSPFTTSPSALYTQPVNKVRYKTLILQTGSPRPITNEVTWPKCLRCPYLTCNNGRSPPTRQYV